MTKHLNADERRGALYSFLSVFLYGESYSLIEASGAVSTLFATWFLLNTPSPNPKTTTSS